MKKTNLFIIFLLVTSVGVALPVNIFSDQVTGFVFKSILLMLGFLFYTISIYHKANALMWIFMGENKQEDEDKVYLIHWARFIAVATLILIIFMISVTAAMENWYTHSEKTYNFCLFAITINLVIDLLFIFITQDIDPKKIANK